MKKCLPESCWIAGQSTGTLKADLLRQNCSASGTAILHQSRIYSGAIGVSKELSRKGFSKGLIRRCCWPTDNDRKRIEDKEPNSNIVEKYRELHYRKKLIG